MTPKTALTDRELIDQFSRLKKMSYPQFKDWIGKYGAASFQMGIEEGESEGAWWTDEEIYQLLRAERIGAERAQRIIDALLSREEGRHEKSDYQM